MTTHPPDDRSDTRRDEASACRWRDTAWQLVLDGLSEAESGAFGEHLFEGCAQCGAELENARAIVSEVDLALANRRLARKRRDDSAATSTFRRRVLRARLLKAATQGAQATTFGSSVEIAREKENWIASKLPGIATVPRFNGDWIEASVPGVYLKLLTQDQDRRYATALVRMEPGASYPSHRHAGREECYVLSGDLSFGDERLTEGDFQVAEAGSVHPVQETEEGCLLLIVSSTEDEALD